MHANSGRKGYYLDHTRQARRWRSTARWRRLRNRILDARPLCAECTRQGMVTGAAEVDHITPIHKGGAFWDQENLQPLCRECHREKTSREMSRKPEICRHGYAEGECVSCAG